MISIARMQLLVWVALCGACGGSSSVTGSVAGNTLTVSESAFTTGNEVVLSDQSSLCKRLGSNQQGKNETTLVLHFTHFVNMQTQAPDPGDYQVVRSVLPAMGDGRFATAAFFKLDDACANTVGFTKGSAVGTITLQGAEPDKHAWGSFNLSFGDSATAEHVTGRFDAPACTLSLPLADRVCL